LISGEALARTGYFDAAAVERDCGLLRNGKAAKLGTFTKLGLGGVVATQLWHHLYLGGGLRDLPDLWHTPAGGATIGHVRRGVINASH